jgi:DNA transformation protein
VTVSADYLQYVLDQLALLGAVSSRRMFGGVGLYCEEFFFGLIDDDTLYLRVDDSNRSEYTARAAAPFRPYADRPQLSMNYYATPAEVLENAGELANWARRSVEAAIRAPAKRASPGPGSARRRRRRTR